MPVRTKYLSISEDKNMRIFKYLIYLLFIFACLIAFHAFFYELPAPVNNKTEEIILSDES